VDSVVTTKQPLRKGAVGFKTFLDPTAPFALWQTVFKKEAEAVIPQKEKTKHDDTKQLAGGSTAGASHA
jgi:hypothetical protein